jgi:hypothetical protein
LWGRFTIDSVNGKTNVWFLSIDGRIKEIHVDNPRIMTLRGAKIGDSEARIKKLYPGQIKTTPHAYAPNGHYLTFYPQDRQDRDYRLVFSTSKGKVTSLSAGKAEISVEGCS